MNDSSGGSNAERISRLEPNVLVDRVYRAIREGILSLELKPGSQLVERDLSARLGVSKSPVRDALQRLAGEGLVTYTANRGITVRQITSEDVSDIQDVREVLEELAIRLSVPRLTKTDIERMEAILREAEAAITENDRSRLAIVNRDFHEAFAQRCGNKLLQQLLSNLGDRIRIIAQLGLQEQSVMDKAHEQHREILRAAKKNDVAEASRIIRAHVHRQSIDS